MSLAAWILILFVILVGIDAAVRVLIIMLRDWNTDDGPIPPSEEGGGRT